MKRSVKRLRLLPLLFLASGCSTPIEHGLNEAAANEVVGALERAGIGAEKRAAEGGDKAAFMVRVPSASAPRALEILRASGLPRPPRRGITEVYGQPSLIPTASEERARYVGALAGEIERTLETVDGIVSARVHLVLAETDPLAVDGKPRNPARASVLVKARGGRSPLPESDVQKLVAGSVPGLDLSAVGVVVATAPDSPEPAATLAAVGPIRVSRDTRPVLLGAALGGLGVLALLAASLVLTARKLAAEHRRKA